MRRYILVVDDYPDVRNMVVTLLNSMAVESRQAGNGAKALEIIENEMPAAIVLDLMMPVMSGFKMLTELYNRYPHQLIPVILLSGVADDHQMRSLPGVIGVLKKGAFSLEDLRAQLVAAIGSQPSAPAQVAPPSQPPSDHILHASLRLV